MKSRFRSLCVVSAVLSLASCDKPTAPAAAAPVTTETDNQLAEARDALQRQALEIETKTALMDKQLAEMEQSVKDRDNAELRGSLDALKRQNEALRVQADAARQQSNAITQRITVTPPPNVAPQPMALPDYSLFYQQLAPFGRWFEVNGYGYCWRPTITVAGWRPYVDGCWVWTSFGWAWQSNEPFGWATYHYGRWVNLARYGWVWVPGSEWAPAWVAWRQSPDCVGWAPLPPEQGVCNGVYRDCDSRYGLGPASYTFINSKQFVSRSYINVYAPVMRQTTIYQHSVNVTQIVPGRGQGHAFVHQGGPPRAQMEKACGQPVPQRQVQTVHAGQIPEQPYHHAGRDALAPVAMVELPAVTPGARVVHPEVKEHIQRPVQMSGFEGVPQQAVREIRETIAREKETAVVQQQPVHGHMPHQAARHPVEAPAVVIGAPSVPNAPLQETVRHASLAEKPVLDRESVTPAATAALQPQRGHERMPHESPRHSVEAPAVISVTPMTNAPTQETVRPVVAAEPSTGVAREYRQHAEPVVGAPAPASLPLENKTVEGSATAAAPFTQPAPAVVTAPPAVMPQPPAEPSVSQQPQQPAAAEKMAAEQGAAAASAEAERARMHAAREQAHAAAMEQRQQQALQERAMAEKRAAEQATANAEVEKSRMQAAAAQQEAQVAQQRMTADQAAAETEKARQQATTAAAQQQQEMAAQQQRMAADQAAAETERARQQAATAAVAQQQEMAAQQQRAATDQAAAETERARQQAATAAAEADRVRQQTEAAAMQRQQEDASRRAAEEQQMRAQQETERRTQEMAAQRQAEEQTRRQQEAETQRAQEQARRAAEEQQMRAQQEAERRTQEMAQRQAEEQVRRQQEAEMQRAQEQARRAAEEQQMRAQQEAAQRAQEMAQRQAEEQARRAQEQAQRQAEEQARRAQEEAQRAAAEAARNQPQPAPGS